MENKIGLNLMDRLVVINLLPEENNYATLKLIRDLKSNLGITDDEFKEFNLKQGGETFVDDAGNEIVVPEGQMMWNAVAGVPKDFEIRRKARKLIVGELEKLDKDGKLTSNHFNVYEKFVEPEQDTDE